MTLKTLLLLVLTSLQLAAQSPYVSKVIEFLPAPGQFVNTAAWGTQAKANSLIGGMAGGISLGGFGGYVIVGFDHRIENDPDNPYGIDFTIFGNPLADGQKKVIWSEPGAVMVMKDENNNGLADDTWYELAGSDYYFSTTHRNYTITYTNPKQVIAAEVPWTDSQGGAGAVLKNDFHLQPYYPLTASFPTADQNQITFTGNRIKGYVDRSDPALIQSYKRGFGYADNALTGAQPYTTPDNPYTAATEGAGGDAFDIDWAVDQQGNHVHLDGVDFIKIYNALNADAGWLGEVSTEIRGVADAAPNAAIQGELDQVVMVDIPLRVRDNTQLPLEAYAFHQGILQEGKKIIFSSDNPSSAEIVNGKLLTKAAGTVTVTASLEDNPAIQTRTVIDVVAPRGVDITQAAPLIRINTRANIAARVTDNASKEIPGLALTWSASDPAVLEINTQGEQVAMRGKSQGSAWLKVVATDIPTLKDSVLVSVLAESDTRRVFLTVRDDDSLIISRRQVSVKNFDINAYVDGPHQDYSIGTVGDVTAAHAIAQRFANEDFASDLRFRDDARGDGKLYLWRVPKGDASNVSYEYGYGGATEASYDRAWFIRVNERTYVNDLHKVLVSEGDEITVYPVNHVGTPWQYIHLRTDKDTVDVDETVTLTVTRFDQSLNADRSVNTLNSDAVSGAPVMVNGASYSGGSTPLLTDDLGKAALTFSSPGVKNIEVAGAHIIVVAGHDTAVGVEEEGDRLVVSPNPFHDFLRITGSFANASYKLISLNGTVSLQDKISADTAIKTDLIPAGLYILRIETGGGIQYFKLVKP
jgi:hypothetical protein